MMRVLYLYSGSRTQFRGSIGSDYPDTQFYGLNHLGDNGIEAAHKEWNDVPGSSLLGRVLDFRIKHLLLYPFTRGYDVVFGSSLLYLVPLKKLFRAHAKFVLLNIGITRTLTAHHQRRTGALVRWLISGLDAVVCLSRFQVAYLEEQFPQLRGKIFFVPLGVDTRFHTPVYDGRKPYILSVGRDNGRDYAAVVAAARHLPEREFQIVCSRRNLTGISLPANVRVFYDLPVADLHAKYREAELLLLLTKDGTEGSDCSGQTVLLDAMASGLPVVVNRKPYLTQMGGTFSSSCFGMYSRA